MALAARVLTHFARRAPAERAAALRIGTSAIWLLELLALRPWQADLYDLPIPGQGVVFDVWMVATVSLLIGFRSHAAATVSFLCFLLFVDLGHAGYHVDYLAQLATFYLMFIDASAAWSLDARLSPAKRAKSSVWALPLAVLLFHAGLVYLDSGLSHLLLNNGWLTGEIVGTSWAHPQWATTLAPTLLQIEPLGHLATYGTLIFETTFWILALWVVRDLAGHRRAGIALFVVILGFQLGILASYDIGLFSPYMIALALPYLPWERLRHGEPIGPEPTSRPIVAGTLLVVATASLLLVPPIALPSGAYGRDGATAVVRRILSLTGDNKPHNVFADASVLTVRVAWVEDVHGVRQAVLFDAVGHRVGDLGYIRPFIQIEQVLRVNAQRSVAIDALAPVLLRAIERSELMPGDYQVVTCMWPVGESCKAGTKRLLSRFSVTQRLEIAFEPD